MKYFFLVIGFFGLNSCGNNRHDLSMKIGRMTALSTPKGKLFFYRILNGLSTDAYFLSKKEDVCKGFNKNEDYYFKVLEPTIYYKSQGDTLYLYTSFPANVPKSFDFNVVQTKISASEDEKYEKMYMDHEIQKVIIDSMSVPNCDVKF